MELSTFAAIGWGLGLFFSGITVGIVGTSLYWTRWRKKALAYINTYKAKVERLEKVWNAKESIEKPGTIEKG